MVQIADHAVTLHVADGHQPIEVHARLQDGLIAETDYVVDFAGLLHSRCRLTNGRPRSDPSTVDDPTVYDLPLARCGFGANWLWAASAAIVEPGHSYDSRTFYRRDDPSWGMTYSARPIQFSVHPTKGPWRDVMMPAPAAVVHDVRWRCVGDPLAIERLLTTVRHIGKRRHSGEGRVLQWQVHTVSDVDDWLRWPFVDNARIIRPCPPAIVCSIPHVVGWHSARPPSWNPTTMAELATSTPHQF